MHDSLRAFLRELIDYAGLFPPAQLPLDAALRNYVDYSASSDSWMLGRFLCPAARLSALIELLPPRREQPLRLTLIGRGGDDSAAFRAGIQDEYAQAADLERAHAGHVRIEGFETRVPAPLLREECSAELVKAVHFARSAAETAGLDRMSIALEAAIGAPRIAANEALSGAISFCNMKYRLAQSLNSRVAAQEEERLAPESSPAGEVLLSQKIRCGGLDAAAFPSRAELAAVIARCVEREVPLKFTAGLHHPFPRFDEGVRAHMHGFVNVFAAAVLAASAVQHNEESGMRSSEGDGPPVSVLAALLEDADPGHFHFDGAGFTWSGLANAPCALWATTQQIEVLRRTQALSFGSCSFDEPRDDLRALAWLP